MKAERKMSHEERLAIEANIYSIEQGGSGEDLVEALDALDVIYGPRREYGYTPSREEIAEVVADWKRRTAAK